MQYSWPKSHMEVDGEEDGEISTTICDICSVNKFKYKCPACKSMKMCSLNCCNEHKLTCVPQDSSLEVIKFIPLSQFTDQHIYNGKTGYDFWIDF